MRVQLFMQFFEQVFCYTSMLLFSSHFFVIDPLCPECIQGKIPNCCFPESNHHTICPFQPVYSDLKMFSTLSYYCQKYLITFYNDFTLYVWISLLITKNKAILVTRQFLAFVKNQYHMFVQIQISGGSKEYKLVAFDKLLGNKGIKILQCPLL